MLENAPSSSDAAGAALLQRGQCVAKPWSHTWAREGAFSWSYSSKTPSPAREVRSPWHLHSAEGWDSHHHKLREKNERKTAKFFRDENHYQSTLHCLWKCSQDPGEALVSIYNRHSHVHIIGTVLYSPTAGKGGCYHPTSQGFNYTQYYQPLKITCLLGHKKDKMVLQFLV